MCRRLWRDRPKPRGLATGRETTLGGLGPKFQWGVLYGLVWLSYFGKSSGSVFRIFLGGESSPQIARRFGWVESDLQAGGADKAPPFELGSQQVAERVLCYLQSPQAAMFLSIEIHYRGHCVHSWACSEFWEFVQFFVRDGSRFMKVCWCMKVCSSIYIYINT